MRVIRGTLTGLLAAAVMIAAGCASEPHQITVSPQLQVGSGAGNGGSVAISVADQRAQPTILGYRSPDDSSLEDAVLAANSVSHAVTQSLRSGLRSLGFSPTSSGGGAVPQLQVRIKNIEFAVSGSGVNKIMSTDVLLAGDVNNGGRHFQATYRVRKEQVAGLTVNPDKEQKVVNAALSAALDNMLQDPRLTHLLSR